MKRMSSYIRSARRQMRLKQSALADLLGVDQATVSRWERGLVEVPSAQFEMVTKLLQKVPDVVPLVYVTKGATAKITSLDVDVDGVTTIEIRIEPAS